MSSSNTQSVLIMDEVGDWMAFYNHSRLHSMLCYANPRRYEERCIAAQFKKAA